MIKIYRHPELGEARVKDGFSWPGFFFSFGWALYKNLWVQGITLAVLVIGSRFVSIWFERQIDANPENMTGTAAMAIVGAGLILITSCIVVGLLGNRWVEKRLRKQGYVVVSPAATPGGSRPVSPDNTPPDKRA